MAITPRGNLRFTHMRVERWKNFAKIDIDLAARSFFVGANATGKSNILDVFRFLRDIARVGGGFREAVESRGGLSSIRSVFARRPNDVIVDVTVGSDASLSLWRYRIAFEQDNNRRPKIKSEVVWRDGNEVVRRPDSDDKTDPERLAQTHLEQINSNQKFRELADFFSTIRYLHIVPQLIREPDRSYGRVNDPYGGDFLETIAKTPTKTAVSRLAKITDGLKVAVPQLTELKLEQDTRGFWHLKGRYSHWRPTGAWQTEDQFSDGTLRLLGLLWALMETGGPLLLEEPELSLHPAVVRPLPALFSRFSRRSGRQILLTTHSEALLSDPGISPREVIALFAREEGTQVETASNLREVTALTLSGLTMAESILPAVRPPVQTALPLFDQ